MRMKNYTKYCSTGCKNEFQELDYRLGIDPRFHRLLITKRAKEASCTISYDLVKEHFVSFHQFYPRKYLFTREDMFAFDGDEFYSFKKVQDDDVLYNHYFGKQYSFIIDVKSILPTTANYYSHIIRTNVEQNKKGNLIKNMHVHFDTIGFWNSYQSGGVHHLVMNDAFTRENNILKTLNDNYGVLPIQRIDNEWRIDEFYDFTGDPLDAVVQKENCLPFITPVNYICKGINIQSYKDRVLKDNVYFTRLTKELPDKKMYIKNMILMYNQKSR